jgi:hypothetical protein
MTVVSLCGCSASTSDAATRDSSAINLDGLASVKSRSLDIAQVRPGTNFADYSGLFLSRPELAYRTPDHSKKEYALTEEQQTRFHEIVTQAFQSEFSKMQSMQVVGERGPGILELSVRIQDIVAKVAPGSLSPVGRGAAFLEASATATLVIELSDSVSNELLARGVDTSNVEGAAMRQGREMVTRWEGVEELSELWASVARTGVSSLVGSAN